MRRRGQVEVATVAADVHALRRETRAGGPCFEGCSDRYRLRGESRCLPERPGPGRCDETTAAAAVAQLVFPSDSRCAVGDARPSRLGSDRPAGGRANRHRRHRAVLRDDGRARRGGERAGLRLDRVEELLPGGQPRAPRFHPGSHRIGVPAAGQDEEPVGLLRAPSREPGRDRGGGAPASRSVQAPGRALSRRRVRRCLLRDRPDELGRYDIGGQAVDWSGDVRAGRRRADPRAERLGARGA